MPRFIPVNLRKGKEHKHPDIKVGRVRYLAKFEGDWHIGTFSRQWYGLHFDCDWGASGIQFDAPGSNGSTWQKLYRIEGLR